jgi:SAM-dependent methyltransferase
MPAVVDADPAHPERPAVVNAEQYAAWNGAEGVYWAEHQDRWDTVNRAVNEPLFAAAAVGEREHVLDVGCGTGLTTRLAARRAPRGRALGLDLSAPMLARARATTAAEGIANVAFAQGDAQAYPFPPGAFDVAISRFGVMFFADPVAAFANIGRALRPGGRLAFVCMQAPSRSELGRVFAAVAARVLPPAAAADPDGAAAPDMYSLADPHGVAAVLAGAGLAGVHTAPLDVPMVFGRDAADAAGFLFGSGPVQDALRGADRATADRFRDALTDALRPYETPDGVRLRGAAWLVRATRP